MKKIYTSIVTAALLTTSACANSSSIKEAFSNGKVSGDISLYVENTSKNGANKDSGFSMSSIGLAYETDSFNGFKGSLGFRSNHKFSEKEEVDFDESTPKTAMSIANISYSTDKAEIIVGRQEIDLEWIGDFHEAVVGVLTYVPDTTIVVGHTTRFMAVDNDSALASMQHIKDATSVSTNNGASVIDIKYDGIKDVTINPYFMNANDVFSAYGLKLNATIASIDITAHYATSSEDVTATKDGSIAHLEVGTSVSDIAFAAGYITTDKEGGIGSLSALGENIAPTEDIDSRVYGTDADSFYVNAGVNIADVSLSAQFTTTTYDAANNKDSEILITAGTTITDNLTLDLLVSSVNAENSTDDTDKVTLMASYSF